MNISMKVSISLGGSLLTRSSSVELFHDYAEALRDLKTRGHIIVVVCGGGRTARQFISFGKELNATNDVLDRLGILATHLNALYMISALGADADKRVHRRGGEVRDHLSDKILVGGGDLPKSSTDYRAALFAGAIDADLIINATDYAGVYDKDPRKHVDAKKYDHLTYKELEMIVKNRFKQEPGDYGLFDLKALRFAAKRKIPVAIIDGTNPAELLYAVEGRINGTLITA